MSKNKFMGAFKKITALGIIGGGIYAGWFYWQRGNGEKVSKGTSGTVTRGNLVQRVTINGFVIPKRKSLITSNYNGYIQKIYVKVGDRVKSGDPIVRVTQTLTGQGDEAYPLRAPFNGKIMQVLRYEGEYVDSRPENGIVRIDDVSELFVQSTVPENDFPKLHPGMKVELKPAAMLQKTYKGSITSIFQSAKDQSTWEKSKVEFPLTVEIANEDEDLHPGMTMMIDVITNQSLNVLMVRHEFIEKTEDGYFVTTEAGSRKEIKVGLQNEESFEVSSGVQEGEKLQSVDFAKYVGP